MSVSGNSFRGVVPAYGTAISSVRATLTAATTWYELIASTSGSIYITAFVGAVDTAITVEIGTGAAGSETTVATTYVSYNGNSASNTNGYHAFTIPIRVATATRVAVRRTTAGGSGGSTMGIAYVSESRVV